MPSELISPTPPKYLQQEETLTQQTKHTISTLPKAKGWLASHLYQYQGFWYPASHLQGLISFQRHFQPRRNDDVLLITTPKSGTTWLKALLFALVNRHHHPITGAHRHPLLAASPHDLVPFLEIKLYTDGGIPDLPQSGPRLFSSHAPYGSLPEPVKEKSSGCRVVYLCRNPKDVFVSLWHFTNGLKARDMKANSMEEVFDLFCRGVSLFGPFWDHVLGYWEKSLENPDGFFFLRFEDMKERPGACLRRLAGFLGCPFSESEEKSGLVEDILEMCSFDHLRALEINRNGRLSSGEENRVFFRKGVVGDWKNYLSDEMAERIDRITEDKFKGSGLII